MSDELFSQGQAAFRAGDKEKAKKIFQSIVNRDPLNENAWLWLAGAADANFERALYLERVLAINPGNTAAQRALDKIRAAMLESTRAPTRTSQLALDISIPPAVNTAKEAKEKKKPKKLTFGRVVYLGFVSVLSLIAGFLIIVWIVEGGIPALFQKSQEAPPEIYTVTYEVTGSAYSAKIEYFIGGDESMLGNSVLPFEKQQTLKAKDLAYVSAENNDETGSVICRIWVNGKIWKESRKAGAFAKVECDGIVKGYGWPP
jgi:tetratricopeptide (TPR) repeat protein